MSPSPRLRRRPAPRGGTTTVPSRTLVAVHAHPDDEALLTAGTMAAAAAAGHRVVLVVCTDGALGEASPAFGDASALAAVRRAETERSAAVLGVSRLVWLGHADSGHADSGHADSDESPGAGAGDRSHPGDLRARRFVEVPIEEAAEQIAAVLHEEAADVVLSYDRNGGYGHPDHVHVHHAVARAAELAGTPRLLEATVPRDLLVGLIEWLRRLRLWPTRYDPTPLAHAYSAKAEITHRISVRHELRAKRAAMRAHTSQSTSRDGGPRTLAALLSVPYPLAWLVLAHEWYCDPAGGPRTGGAAGRPVSTDVFEGLR